MFIPFKRKYRKFNLTTDCETYDKALNNLIYEFNNLHIEELKRI